MDSQLAVLLLRIWLIVAALLIFLRVTLVDLRRKNVKMASRAVTAIMVSFTWPIYTATFIVGALFMILRFAGTMIFEAYKGISEIVLQ